MKESEISPFGPLVSDTGGKGTGVSAFLLYNRNKRARKFALNSAQDAALGNDGLP